MDAIGTQDRRTILVVEDEDLVRTYLYTFLRHEGYEVLVAATGKRGVELAQAHHGDIHLLVCNWMMSGLDGPAVATQIEAARPGLNVILLSASDPGLPVKAGWTFFPKPFDRVEFLETIRDLLKVPTNRFAANGAV